MQKPFTSASVGKRSAASLFITSQPRRTIASASPVEVILVNSSTSAPAMKPEDLPERMMSARGFFVLSSSSIAENSATASAESVLVEDSALSNVSQTMLSRSVSGFQCL